MDKTKIIVVEDNIVYCEFVCNLLAREKFRTVQAFHLSTAKKLLQQATDNDIVVSDLRLPDGDGILLLEELRREGKHNPYVIMTDYAEVPTAVRSMKSGAEDYIPKKLLTSQLPAMLQDLQKRQSFHVGIRFLPKNCRHTCCTQGCLPLRLSFPFLHLLSGGFYDGFSLFQHGTGCIGDFFVRVRFLVDGFVQLLQGAFRPYHHP